MERTATNQFPALFQLFAQDLLPRKTRIIGYARSDLSLDKFRERLVSHIDKIGPGTGEKLEQFQQLCEYVRGAYDADEGYEKLSDEIEKAEDEMKDESSKFDRLFYLALPPVVFGDVCTRIRRVCYNNENRHTKIIIEKPFGRDLETSRELQKVIAPLFSEQEIYRIDHYLGKEMVKSILILRFANLFMTACWTNHYVSSVQITFKETFGTEGRGGYFDSYGIIRDVIQNHLLQVLSLIAMERPVSFSPEDIRDEKVKVLKAISFVEEQDVVLGQYTQSEDGSKPAYTDDETIKNKDSKTPTFACVCVKIHNERWEGVPFILKAGKALDQQKVEVRLQLKDVAQGMFDNIARNELVLTVQPSEAIYMKINAKYPGLSTQTVVTDLDVSYHRRFSNFQIPQAYEALLLDCLNGDHSNFVRDDELEQAWRIFTPLLHRCDRGELPVEPYPYGSRGPPSTDPFVRSLGFKRTQEQQSYSWPVTRAAD